MALPTEVTEAAKALRNALLATDAYTQFRKLEDSVMADEVNARLIERYSRAQQTLQLAAMSGNEPPEEARQEFEKLSLLLLDHAEISEYLLAKMRIQQMTAEAIDIFAGASGFHV